MTTKVTITPQFAGRVVHVKPHGGQRTILTPENPSVNVNLHDGTVTIFEGATFEDHKRSQTENNGLTTEQLADIERGDGTLDPEAQKVIADSDLGDDTLDSGFKPA